VFPPLGLVGTLGLLSLHGDAAYQQESRAYSPLLSRRALYDLGQMWALLAFGGFLTLVPGLVQ
jgi:hypothetical protein